MRFQKTKLLEFQKERKKKESKYKVLPFFFWEDNNVLKFRCVEPNRYDRTSKGSGGKNRWIGDVWESKWSDCSVRLLAQVVIPKGEDLAERPVGIKFFFYSNVNRLKQNKAVMELTGEKHDTKK